MFWLRLTLGALAFTGAGLQFFGPARPANAAAAPNDDMHAFVRVPGDVDAILNKACVNCHTNQTDWPWYARVAPVSWLVNEDVVKGRRAFNMSEWRNRYAAKPAIAATLLVSGCSSLKSGRMPLPQYLLMHPGAKLAPDELDRYCGWAKQEAKSLLRSRRSN